MNYDIIGDIHGQYERLNDVLKRLGYRKKDGIFTLKGHKAIFVGDLVDRGPDSAKVVELVKRMVENNCAEAVLGNHEFNWIGYNIKRKGDFLRPHITKNIKQCKETISSYDGKNDLLNSHLNWLTTLPLYIDKKRFRVVHACWDVDSIKVLLDEEKTKNGKEIIHSAYKSGHKLKGALKTLLSGPELKLPDGIEIEDTDGTSRVNFRYKWWAKTKNKTCRELTLKHPERIPNILVGNNVIVKNRSYSKKEKPLFIGHYSLPGKPVLMKSNLCCLDWVNKTNRIAVYRFKDEGELNEDNLVYFH